jgi:hypothetical protein
MFVVVPVEEASAVDACILLAAEAIGEARAILERLAGRLGERGLSFATSVGPRMRLRHAEVGPASSESAPDAAFEDVRVEIERHRFLEHDTSALFIHIGELIVRRVLCDPSPNDVAIRDAHERTPLRHAIAARPEDALRVERARVAVDLVHEEALRRITRGDERHLGQLAARLQRR